MWLDHLLSKEKQIKLSSHSPPTYIFLDHNIIYRSVNRGRDKNLRAKGHMVDALAPNDDEGRG